MIPNGYSTPPTERTYGRHTVWFTDPWTGRPKCLGRFVSYQMSTYLAGRLHLLLGVKTAAVPRGQHVRLYLDKSWRNNE